MGVDLPDGWQRAGMPWALRLRRAGPFEGSLLGIAGVKPVVGKGRRGSSQVSEGQAFTGVGWRVERNVKGGGGDGLTAL